MHIVRHPITPYSRWRLAILSAVGKMLGVKFLVWGVPFGAVPKDRDGVSNAILDRLGH